MKKKLEETFDIPFHVNKGHKEYIIWPENEMEELFVVRIYLRSEVRVIAEAYPQNHAANMLNDMALATEEKKKLFFGYRDMFERRGCRVSIQINNTDTDLSEWPDHWKNMYMRISKITEADSVFEKIATDWSILLIGMILSLLNVIQIEQDPVGYKDGQMRQVLSNIYERNPLNRELCLQANGYICKICGFNFEGKYGIIGRKFIHVHHIEQLSLAGGAHIIDPVHDLIPVCPNCHAMLHTSKPPLLPEQLIEIIRENNQ